MKPLHLHSSKQSGQGGALKNIHMTLPGQNVLILGAICISIIGSIGAYRFAEYQKATSLSNSGYKQGSLVASGGGSDTASSSRVSGNYAQILTNIELANIDAKAAYENPFLPKDSDTLTDRLSKNVFVSYLQTQKSDGSAANSQEELATQVVANIDTSQLPTAKYSLNTVNMFYPKTKAEIKAYGNAFAEIRTRNLQIIAANPAKYEKDIAAVGDIMKKIGEELITIRVPSEVALAHLDIVNGYIRTGEAFKIIADEKKDPLKALLGLKIFKEENEKQAEMFTQIGNYFVKNAILFDKAEPGDMWNVSTTQASGSSQ